eukprot:TRINITY_DN8524_c0_g1_i1.p1 TRINITY_DN8524_c0_g1~~TRINITY_DN8524_c0_g1_i1.p1  ORF type:complete len:437 (+),score=143.42 TRINITY_DN8524_c0_g1_i1:57-1313(+)
MPPAREYFGEQLPFCEPYWYQGQPSPYYHDGHKAFRTKVRRFVEEEIKPNVDGWIKNGYPRDLHVKAYQAGVAPVAKELGGPADYDAFYELILLDEMSRVGGGNVLGQSAINSMALPPIVKYASKEIRDKVVRDVVEGRKHVCLAISEPGAGSDVGNIQCKAVKDGDHYVVTGYKKWITGGMMGDYFTTAVRTGKPGMFGISLLLIERGMPGVSIRKMETQFDNAHSTTFVTFDKVRVPVSNLIGKENQGFRYLMFNFNHERFVISVAACRNARNCFELAFKYALQRKTFGKRLIDHQIIRFKLAEVARQVESLHDNCERVAYAFSNGVPDSELGGQCALLKVQGSKTLEYAAREASQIFGGSSIVKEGKGKLVERIYREVRAAAIPGGSEEILLDFTMRQAAAKGPATAPGTPISKQ